jgi:hypothetical protein
MKITIGLLASIFLLLSSFSPKSENEDQLPFISSYSSSVKSVYQQHLEKYDYSEYTNEQDILQLKCYHSITKEKAKKIIDDRTFFTLSMFKEQPSPYPGVLSSSIGCPKEYQPKVSEDTFKVRASFKLLATKNLIYGNCNPSDNYFYCAYCIFFCEEKNELYELKIFTPIKNPSFDYETFSTSIQCK